MPILQEQRRTSDTPPPFRLDVQLHDLLKRSPAPRPLLQSRELQKFPQPVFPQHPELMDMKDFLRGKVEPWNCRAGQNSLIIRVDGSLAPCFPMYSASHDWGTIENHNFQVPQLNELKKSCQAYCFSTLNHNLGFCYNDSRVIKWVLKQAAHGFQGVSGNFA